MEISSSFKSGVPESWVSDNRNTVSGLPKFSNQRDLDTSPTVESARMGRPENKTLCVSPRAAATNIVELENESMQKRRLNKTNG